MTFLVIGLGSMGKRRIRNLQFLEAGTIHGFDPREDRRDEAHRKYGIQTFADLDEALATAPDALVVSTPPDWHMPYMMRAAEMGVHFFSEASVVDDGMDRLIALCEGKDLVAAPSCTLRFHPSVRLMKEIIDDGSLGKVLAFTHHCGQYLPDWHPWEDISEYYVGQRETGGAREIVPFELVWMTWLLGDVKEVSCFAGKVSDLHVDIDDVYQLLLRSNSGAMGHLLVDVVARTPYRNARILAEKGVIEWDWNAKHVRVFRAESGEWEIHEEPESFHEAGYIAAENMYIDEMASFIGAIRGEDPFPHTLSEDKYLLDVLQLAERSAAEGRHVEVTSSTADTPAGASEAAA